MFIDRILTIVKMAVFLELIYKFNVTLIEILIAIFAERTS